MSKLMNLIAGCVIVGVVTGGTMLDRKAVAQDKPAKKEKGTDVYGEFNDFCIKHFGAEKEPLIYEKFGKKLTFLENGSWKHVSENSACLAWETNLPAKSYVEYGLTKNYGQRTAATERHFYLHIHHLKGLQVGKVYHYRLVAIDERGNRVKTQGAKLQTKKIEGAVYLSKDANDQPYEFDKADTTYIFTKDITADGTAIIIKANNVTLDLNGHTLTYDEQKQQTYEVYGVTSRYSKGIRILNGTIRQGNGNDSAQAGGLGVSAIYLNGGDGEIAGVKCIYTGAQITGIYLRNSSEFDAHHNLIEDRGTKMVNRHSGCAGMTYGHHNLIKRARQWGIMCRSNSVTEHNEIYIDSVCTNAKGIFLYKHKNVTVRDNRIFGTGYLMYGISPVAKSENVKIHDNLVHVEGVKPLERWKGYEYGAVSWLSCLRLTWGGKNLEYFDNLLIANGRDGAWVSGIWFQADPRESNVVLRDNIFKMMYTGKPQGGRFAEWSAAIDVCGVAKKENGVIILKDNTIISNYRHIGGDGWYGPGGNAEFWGNKLVRVGNRPDYLTIYCGFWKLDAWGNKFYDMVFEGDVGYDQIKFDKGTGKMDVSVGWTLTVKTASGAEVTIKDTEGRVVFTGNADDQGKVKARVLEYVHNPEGKTCFTPHEITVQKDGKTKTKSVKLTKKQEVLIKLQ